MTWFFAERSMLVLFVAALALAAVSCTVGPNYTTPKASIAGEWTQHPVVTNQPPNAAESFWWRSFNDPVLNELVETAYRNNPSLQIAAHVQVPEQDIAQGRATPG